MDQHPPPSSSRSPRSRLVIGGRMAPAQLHQATQVNHQQQQQKQHMTADDRNGQELRTLDCNLSALCDHIQVEGFHAGAFSDVVVHAMGSTYRLHRLILSRSSYFRNMLHGPWKEADARTVTLQIDDDNVNSEAISMSLAYLYGHHPKLDDSNAFRVLAAASFLDLQDLCTICTDFIISELRTSNFLAYQVFAESQDYGIHGDRVRKACWGYLCQSGARELREVLSRLSSQTLQSLLTSDKLWVPNEEKRFELALYTLLAKGAINKEQMEQSLSSPEPGLSMPPHSSIGMECKFMNDDITRVLQSELEHVSVQDNSKGHKAAHKVLDDLAECAVDFQNDVSYPNSVKLQEINSCQLVTDSFSCQMERLASSNSSLFDPSVGHTSCSQMQNDLDTERTVVNGSATEGPSEESTCYPFHNNVWLSGDHSRQFTSDGPSCNETVNIDRGKHGMVSPSWGARTVGWCQGKSVEENYGIFGEEFDAFVSIFEGGSLLYCNMSFEALLDARKKLEEMGFPCKAVNDGLWLQMLLSHKIQEVGADTCRNCCLISMSCACRQPYGYPQGVSFLECHRQENDRNHTPGTGNVYLADAQGEENGVYESVRIHARGAIDGLAGIGRGATFVSNSGWPPTRFVFSRVPFGLGNRNCQQTLGNDEPEASAELSGDSLTAFVGSSQGANTVPVHMEHAERTYVSGSSNIPATNKPTLGLEDWEDSEVSSLSLDMKTPLRHFPPFRFGVEFEDVHRLGDSQVKHSPEMFYAGSLWKVSVQAFYDEDPQGRRTLGLFLHRRKAELNEPLRKVHTYVDSREKVTARYQLICPSKREIMVFGSLKQPGTLLPKAPKGWGWRTALLFTELADLLQGGSLRVAAVVQLI